jgi:GGDEF domain-containing protein
LDFLIILDKFHHIDDVTLVAQDLLKLIEEPVLLSDKKISHSASIGISIFPMS